MPTLNEAKETIYSRFIANYTGVPQSRIAFENEKFDTPDASPWVRVSIRSTSRVQDTLGRIGNRRFRSTASLFVQVYTTADVGVQQGDTLATEALELFEGLTISDLDFQNAIVRETGLDGRWFQHVMEAEFEYDVIK